MFQSQKSKQKEIANQAIDNLMFKAKEISPIVERMKNGNYNGNSDELQTTYNRLAMIEGNSLGLQIECNEKGYKDLVKKAADIYKQAQGMKVIVESTAEKNKIKLDDDPEED